jgi:hypothetical protein
MPKKTRRFGPKNAAPEADYTQRAANRVGTSGQPRKSLQFASLQSSSGESRFR